MKTRSVKLYFALLVLFLIIAVPTSSIATVRYGDRKAERGSTNKVNPNNLSDNFDGISAFINVTSFSASTLTANLHFEFVLNFLDGKPRGFTATIASKVVTFTDLDFSPQVDVPITISGEVKAQKYPFDTFATNLNFVARLADSTSIPLAVQLIGAIDSWSVNSQLIDVSNNIVIAHLFFQRSPVQQFFSIFIQALMWFLSLATISLTFVLWFKRRRLDANVITVVGSLLFALPAIRNVQPGLPPVGSLTDVASFFWALGLVSTSFVVLIVLFLIQNRQESRNLSTDSYIEMKNTSTI